MSVRRLADESVQPKSFAFTAENLAWAEKRMALFPEGRQQSAVIPVLWRAQEQEGWVSRAAIETVAKLLGMATIRVLEVATFYTQFQLQPVGSKAHVQVCGTTPCMLRGAEGLRHVCEKKIHAEPHHVNGDGTLSWEEVECLGACVNAPMVMIGEDTFEDLTPERLAEIIDAFERGEGRSVPPGPQNGRQFSAPLTGPTSLRAAPTPDKAAERTGAVENPPPTKAGRRRQVSPEAAPALVGPKRTGKVSVGLAESERIAGATAAKANGHPNKAARETATGAESAAAKIRGGASVEKPPAPDGAKPERARKSNAPTVTPEGAADDLTLISGVGTVLQKKLNELGVTRFDQIAAFGTSDIDKLEQSLGFRGRIVREDWVKQAEALAKGGAVEYRRVFGKEPR